MQKDESHYALSRLALIDGLRRKGISDEQVLIAMTEVPRHLFMPAELRHKAYIDKAFPIGAGQTISQPYTVAYQTQLLDLHPSHRVLEIGTGSAYQAAILAELGAEVYTIERQKTLYDRNRHAAHLKKWGNLHCCYGDGFKGWPAKAPFDRILITAAPTVIPATLPEQLKDDGKMVLPVGPPGLQRMKRLTKHTGGISEELFDFFSFVPMVKGISN